MITAEENAALDLAAAVKHDLVEFGLSDKLARHLRKCLRSVAGQYTSPDQLGVAAMEQLLFEYEFDDGTTVIDRFLQESSLNDSKREMIQGFAAGVDSIYEVLPDRSQSPRDFTVRCCVSDLEHRVAPTLEDAMQNLAPGTFLVGRLNPVAGTDLWTPSGDTALLPASARPEMAEAALQLAVEQPWKTYRNPERYRKALEHTEQLHQRFIDLHASDMVSTTGQELAELYAEASVIDGIADEDALAAARDMSRRTITESHLVDEPQVTLVSHPIAGFGFYVRLDDVNRALHDGNAATTSDLDILTEYLQDPDIPQWLLHRLIIENLPTSQEALQRVLGKPNFSWERDGESWLASCPGDPEPGCNHSIAPSIYVESIS
ncbi:hypothetical protein [Enteractinococcus helveticum]|uniref:Uncharacterized protein n=1 Tax=Enteractinococcus helveticum TaxID=1837282 RepID=A0A1B7M257_9MICC|nr:hypothetical protein [Enteractinococcus helveticum]OAV62645.1 hypothetical protein A6F49_05655 [Enteractinococcus helveticum]